MIVLEKNKNKITYCLTHPSPLQSLQVTNHIFYRVIQKINNYYSEHFKFENIKVPISLFSSALNFKLNKLT